MSDIPVSVLAMLLQKRGVQKNIRMPEELEHQLETELKEFKQQVDFDPSLADYIILKLSVPLKEQKKAS